MKTIKKDTIFICRATPDDIEGIMDVQRTTWLSTYVNKEYGITADDIKTKDFTSFERKKRWKKSLVEDKEILQIWVAKNNTNQVIAFVTAKKGEKSNIIGAIYVILEYQGKGIGKKLMSKAFEWLGKSKNIYLDVVTYNQKAIEIYEKLGFKTIGETPSDELAKLPSGKTMPEIRMIKSYHTTS